MILIALLAAVTADESGVPRALEGLATCRRIADPEKRLSCYDRETASLDTAIQSRKVVVLDQEDVKWTRRSLFGFPLPSIKLFGGGDKDTRAEEDDLKRIETTVSAASRSASGGVAFTVEGGARWVQDDDRTLMLARIKPGGKVTISRGALGSYFATFAGGGAAKVRRER